MKKLNKMFFVLVLVFIIASLFVACNGNTTNDNLSDDQFTVTVHPNNGEKAFVWKISDDIPIIEREGYYLDGIYLDSLFMSATSFESLKKTGFDGNLDVYVKWVSHKHEFGSWYILVQPTHITEGLRVWYCSLCDSEKYENMQIIGEHVFSDIWTIDIEPTKTTTGEKSHHCTIPGCTARKDVTVISKEDSDGSDIPHEHNMILVKKVPATCTTNGFEIRRCIDCDYAKKIELSILNGTIDHSQLLAGEMCEKCGYVSISNLRQSVLLFNSIYNTYCAEYYGKSTEKDIFKYYNQRINLAYLSDTIETISKDSFKDWSSLDHIIIPNSITKIETNAFYGCSLLNEVSIPDSVEEIEESAFAQCINLEKITMSQSLKHIGKNVLWSTKWFANQSAGVLYLGNVAVAIKQGCLKIEAIKEGTRIVADEFFAGQSELSIITIPSTILYFGSKVFLECPNLTGVYYNAVNAECRDGLFGSMKSIEHVVFGEKVKVIPSELFSNCSSISDISFADNNSLSEIGAASFSGCNSIKTIAIPDSIVYIKDDAFLNCTSLTHIESNVYATGIIAKQCASRSFSVCITGSRRIPSQAFASCSGLTNVMITNSVLSIGSYAFSNCRNLKDIIIPINVTSIDDYAFSNCTGLETVFYVGTEEQWKTISINSNGNSSFTSAIRVYNSDGAEHTYSFVTNCEQSVDPITATYLTSLLTLTRDGYHFCGWYDNEAFEGKAVSAPYGNKDKTRLYAKWLTEEEWLALPYNGTSFAKAFIAESGQTYDVTITTGVQIVYFVFTPTTSGSFTIQSTGSGDTYGTLYSSTQSSLKTSDDDGDGNNFKITYTMTAGTTYYVAVKFVNPSATGTFKVSIS